MSPSEATPPRIGPFHVLEEIGQGGMGVVYLVEQREPIRRRVALKLIQLGMNSKEVVARFEAERQALALMSHPAIAQVHDAGTAEDGRPYFVMEYVAGEPLTRFCATHRLPTRERLPLFVQVCRGIHHAHERGVIHRDIKPSNILVTQVDDRPVAKIIDFGIAKAVSQRLTEKTVYTELGRIIGTPAYMSPEQAASSDQGIDKRTDVYSLGVLLHELLVGVPPFDPLRLSAAGYLEIQRIIQEEEPPRPSTHLRALGASAGEFAQTCQTKLSTLRGELQAGLDWIVLRALQKDRTRRYDDAAALAADVERFLEGKPLAARPPTLAYRLRRFRRRYGRTLGMVAVAILCLGAGIWLAGREAARAPAAVTLDGGPRPAIAPLQSAARVRFEAGAASWPITLRWGAWRDGPVPAVPGDLAQELVVAAGDPRLRASGDSWSVSLEGLVPSTWYFFAMLPAGERRAPLVASHTLAVDPAPSIEPATDLVLEAVNPSIPPLVFDADRDGRDDVVVIRPTLVVDCHLSDGKGGFRPAKTWTIDAGAFPTAAAVTDIDDQAPDVFLAADRRIWGLANIGNGKFKSMIAPPGQQGRPIELTGLGPEARVVALRVGDFDGDGLRDLAAAVAEGQRPAEIRILFGVGEEGTSLMQEWSWIDGPRIAAGSDRLEDLGLVVVDLDGDGVDDLVHGYTEDGATSYRALLMSRERRAPREVRTPAPSGHRVTAGRYAFADVTEDGLQDLIALYQPATAELAAYKGDGRGGFAVDSPQSLCMLESHLMLEHGSLRVLDADRDGLLDLAVRTVWQPSGEATSRMVVWFGERDPTTGRQRWLQRRTLRSAIRARWSGRSASTELLTGDLDGDSQVDFAAVHHGSATSTLSFLRLKRRSTPRFAQAWALCGTVAIPAGASTPVAVRMSERSPKDLFLGCAERSLLVAPMQAVDGLPLGLPGPVRALDLEAALPAGMRLREAMPAVLDGDGCCDFFFLASDGSVGALRSDGFGPDGLCRYAGLARAPDGVRGVRIHAGRFSSSPHSQVLVVDGTPVVGVLRMAGQRLERAGELRCRAAPRLLRLVDVTADGLDDVLALCPGSGGQDVLEMHLAVRRAGDAGIHFLESVAPDGAMHVAQPVASLTAVGSGFWNSRVFAGSEDGQVLFFPIEGIGGAPPCYLTAEGATSIRPGTPLQVHAARFDEDAWWDLAVAPQGESVVSIFTSRGSRPSPDTRALSRLAPIQLDLGTDRSVLSLTSDFLDGDPYRDLIVDTRRRASGERELVLFLGLGGL